jgi:hypothetical protein
VLIPSRIISSTVRVLCLRLEQVWRFRSKWIPGLTACSTFVFAAAALLHATASTTSSAHVMQPPVKKG